MAKRISPANIAKLLIVLLFAASVVCGVWGWAEFYALPKTVSQTPVRGWSDWVYATIQLFTLNSSFDDTVPPVLNIARFLAPLALAGTIIGVVMSLLGARLRTLVVRLLYRKHIVIYGHGPESDLLVEDLVKLNRVVCIVPEDDEEAEKRLGALGAMVLKAASGSDDWMRAAALGQAAYFFVAADSDEAVLTVSHRIEDFLGASTVRPVGFIHFSDLMSLRMAQHLDEHLELAVAPGADAGGMVMRHSFNLFQSMARRLIDEHMPNEVMANPPVTEAVQVAIFGFGLLGQALLHEAAHLYHFASLQKTRITLVDSGIHRAWEDKRDLYPGIKDCVDLRLVEKDDWQESASREAPAVCFVTFDEWAHSIDMARRIRQASILAQPIRADQPELVPPRILVVPPLDLDAGFATEKPAAIFWRQQNVQVASPSELLANGEIINRTEACELMAKGIHFSWVAHTTGNWDDREVERAWNCTTDLDRNSNRYAARHLLVKLRWLGWKTVPLGEVAVDAPRFDYGALTTAQRELLGRVEHNRWVAEKLLAGYRYASFHPQAAKVLKNRHHLHHNLVAWEELSADDQEKDLNALRHANEVLRLAGLGVAPLDRRGE